MFWAVSASIIAVCLLFTFMFKSLDADGEPSEDDWNIEKKNQSDKNMYRIGSSGGKARLFSKYLKRMERISIVQRAENGSVLSAALLYTIIDRFNLSTVSANERENCAKNIFSCINSEFSNAELMVFDYAVDKMGEVIRGDLNPRGEWGYYLDDARKEDWLFHLFVFFGDCLVFGDLIFNYETAPIHIINPMDSLSIQEEMYKYVFQTIALFVEDFSKL